MEKYLLSENKMFGGVQKIYKFENSYGASVIKHRGSYGGDKGLWELAVILFDGEKWELNYDTEITNDVIGYIKDDELIEILEKIKNLRS